MKKWGPSGQRSGGKGSACQEGVAGKRWLGQGGTHQGADEGQKALPDGPILFSCAPEHSNIPGARKEQLDTSLGNQGTPWSETAPKLGGSCQQQKRAQPSVGGMNH